MKRYRILGFDFDARATSLGVIIQNDWELNVKQRHWQNKFAIIDALQSEYGRDAFAAKLTNFIDLGPAPLSVIAFHNAFARQARVAFIMAAYYPALTAACALGERILNHLIRRLREHFCETEQYKRVYRKESFDDWPSAIEVLDSWGVLLPDTVNALRELALLRNRALHFDPETDTNDRASALEALRLLDRVIESQFAAYGPQPWFMDVPGAAYIKKSWEGNPFIREIYLPNAVLVGPRHTLANADGSWVVRDIEYEDREISDQEFAQMLSRGSRRNEAAPPDA